MINSELNSLIVLGEQIRNVELKQSVSWNDPTTKAKVVKAVLGLSNLRNGGFLIIGVEENDGVFNPVGITEEHLNTYNYDNVMCEISRFADPKAIVRMEIVEDTELNKKFLVFIVDEFEEIPVICKRNGLENLKEGTIYTRSLRLPSTVSVPTQSEMREIMDMATEKGIKKYIKQSKRAGLTLGITEEFEEYDNELEGIR